MDEENQEQLHEVLKEEVAINLCYKRLFATDDGKRVLKHLMDTSFVLQSTYDPNPQTSAFKEGQRATVLAIFNMIEMPVELLIEYLKGK